MEKKNNVLSNRKETADFKKRNEQNPPNKWNVFLLKLAFQKHNEMNNLNKTTQLFLNN